LNENYGGKARKKGEKRAISGTGDEKRMAERGCPAREKGKREGKIKAKMRERHAKAASGQRQAK
jgi:hypothetical protein